MRSDAALYSRQLQLLAIRRVNVLLRACVAAVDRINVQRSITISFGLTVGRSASIFCISISASVDITNSIRSISSGISSINFPIEATSSIVFVIMESKEKTSSETRCESVSGCNSAVCDSAMFPGCLCDQREAALSTTVLFLFEDETSHRLECDGKHQHQ